MAYHGEAQSTANYPSAKSYTIPPASSSGAIQGSQIKQNRFANEVADKLAMIIQRMGANNDRLEMALDRSFGSSPKQETCAEAPTPNSHVNMIAVQLSRLDNMISDQQAKIGKLEEII